MFKTILVYSSQSVKIFKDCSKWKNDETNSSLFSQFFFDKFQKIFDNKDFSGSTFMEINAFFEYFS